MQITEAASEFLGVLAAEGRSPHTVAAYRRDLDAFCRFTGNITLQEVTPNLLLRFMASQSVQIGPCGTQRAKATINRYRVSLKALFAWCEARWLVRRNPAGVLKCQRHRAAPPEILSDREVEAVLGAEFSGRHARRDKALVAFLLLTGCRLGETVALDVGDLDLEAGHVTLRCRKGGEPDRVPLSDQCIAALTVYLGRDTCPDAPLFTTSAGRRLSCRQVQRLVETRMRQVGVAVHVTPHTLRHTFATRLYNRTGDIRLVQEALRHEFISTTQIYAHVDPQRLRRAVNGAAAAP